MIASFREIRTLLCSAVVLINGSLDTGNSHTKVLLSFPVDFAANVTEYSILLPVQWTLNAK